MQLGPYSHLRPTGAVGNDVRIARTATGTIREAKLEQSAMQHIRLAEVEARQQNTTVEDRKAIAQKAAAARWV